MTRSLSAVLVLSFTLTSAAAAQSTTCQDSGGVIHDDGTFESGVGWSQFATRGEYVMRIDPPSPGRRIDAACLCWMRDQTDTTVFFDINVWAADGAGGKPGTLLGKLPTQTATSVAFTPKFYRYDLSSLNIPANGSVYIGPSWSPSDDQHFFVCVDTNGPVQQPAYGGSSILGGPPTSALGQVGFFPEYRTLGIRAKFGDEIAACIPSATAMCLNGGRFKVEATFTNQGSTQSAKVVKLTDETGYFWFFSASNVEAVVKVINGCGLTNSFWVFAGGLTDVNVVLKVTDTKDGTFKTYTNPAGTAFRPIQDTQALATCP
jgi:hypothetical protein